MKLLKASALMAVLLVCAVLMLGVLSLSIGMARNARAKEDGKAFTSPRIAVLDVAHVYANYVKKVEIEKRLTTEVDELEKKLKGKGKEEIDKAVAEIEKKKASIVKSIRKDIETSIQEFGTEKTWT